LNLGPSRKRGRLEPARQRQRRNTTCRQPSGSAIARVADRKSFPNVLKYAQRLPKEFEIVTAVAVKRDPGLAETSAFGKWAVSNQDVVI